MAYMSAQETNKVQSALPQHRAQFKEGQDWAAYHRLKKYLKNVTRKAHSDYVNSILSDALQMDNKKPFWNYIKSQCKDAEGVAPLTRRGVLHSSSAKLKP